jgi:hypothetical protein
MLMFVKKDRYFGYVHLEFQNYDWFRPMIYEPQGITLVSNKYYRVKLKIFNVDGVSLCSAVEHKQDNKKLKRAVIGFEESEIDTENGYYEYMEWQQLDKGSTKMYQVKEDFMSDVQSETRFDNIHGDNIWEGVVSFKKGTTVFLLAQCGYENFVPVASWSLKHVSEI